MVSLATDKGVWDAVLANQKIQEFRQGFNGFEGKSFLSVCRQFGRKECALVIPHKCFILRLCRTLTFRQRI